jgi:hypothetical protein
MFSCVEEPDDEHCRLSFCYLLDDTLKNASWAAHCDEPYYRRNHELTASRLPLFEFGFVKPESTPCNRDGPDGHWNIDGYGKRDATSFLYLEVRLPIGSTSGVCLPTECRTENGNPILLVTSMLGETQTCRSENDTIVFGEHNPIQCNDPVLICNLLIIESAKHPNKGYAYPNLVQRRVDGEAPSSLDQAYTVPFRVEKGWSGWNVAKGILDFFVIIFAIIFAILVIFMLACTWTCDALHILVFIVVIIVAIGAAINAIELIAPLASADAP